MSDQASEQSPQDLSIEERFAALEAPEVPEEETEQEGSEEQPAPQDNEEEATDAEEEGTPEEEQADTEEEEAEPDLVEIERNGKTFKIPKELEGELLMHADYTRKTQASAEKERQLQQMEAELELSAQVQQQNLAEYAKLMSLDGQLQAYDQINWNQLYDADPAEFVRLKESKRDLLDQRATMIGSLSERHEQQATEAHYRNVELLTKSAEKLPSIIKGWTPELGKRIGEYAVKSGLPPKVVAPQFDGKGRMITPGIADPAIISILHKAYLYEQQLSAKPLTEKKVAKLPPVSKPGGPSNKSVATSREQEARKALKKSGSVDDAQALFLARYSNQ